MAQLRSRASMAALFMLLAATASGNPDLYIRDTPADTGIEPNSDPGPMWISEDIWVRKDPDPNYSPYPFPTASPPWTPAAHQEAEYRDPKFGAPNYVYVRVTNRGTTASAGGEWLKLYWAKASTGLSWPTQWVDYLANNCGPTKLYGIEITKERENAATATQAERDLYRDAILDAANQFFPGDPTSFWHKQNHVHVQTPSGGNPFPIHQSLTFNPWHREMINRYEVMLQEANPTVKLLYWNWRDHPVSGPLNFFTPTFMGASGASSSTVVSIGAPFLPALAPPPVTRRLRPGAPPASPDNSILGVASYPNFRSTLEQSPNHDASHVFIGNQNPGGSMSFTNTAASDPFFFLLHANVDRLWAKWQRDPFFPARVDPNLTYAPQSANPLLTGTMGPWNGQTNLPPYTTTGGYIFAKSSKHQSVVFPPIYDDVKLQIPALQVGQSIILEIPFYPPDPANFACFSDAGHFCLLARVVDSDTSPYGMTTLEGPGVNANTQANNNIAWRNITVVDDFQGSALVSTILVRNVFKEEALTTLQLAAVAEADGANFYDYGGVKLELHPDLYERWLAGGAKGKGIKVENADGGRPVLLVDPDATLENIRLPADAGYFVKIHFELRPDYPAPRGLRPRWDMVQLGTPKDKAEVVGGQRFQVDFNKLVLSPEGADWSYETKYPGKDWEKAEYDPKSWRRGKAALGFADFPTTTLDTPSPEEAGTTYFRRNFTVGDPGVVRDLYLRLKSDDAAIVYLNGKEVHRFNLPAGAVDDDTAATQEVEGVEEEVFIATKIPADLLLAGENLIAAEVHQSKKPDPDLTFDLELAANLGQDPVEPGVAFAAHLQGGQFQVGQPIPIVVDGFGSDGRRIALTVAEDDKILVKSKDAPLVYDWKGATKGPHRLKATAVDRDGVVRETFATINVLENLPPNVRISSPRDGVDMGHSGPYAFTAEASDPLGEIDRVEFYIKEGMFFGSQTELLGIAKTPPYTVYAEGLPEGHWMVWAIAYDKEGAYTDAAPIHVGVGHAGGH